MGNRTPQAVKEKGKTESAALSAASPPSPVTGGVSAELTASLGGELGNSGAAQRAAGREGQRALEKQPQNNSLFV